MNERIKNGHEAKSAMQELAEFKKDERFKQLLDEAESGDENAVGDLWREFGFQYPVEGQP